MMVNRRAALAGGAAAAAMLGTGVARAQPEVRIRKGAPDAGQLLCDDGGGAPAALTGDDGPP